MDPQRDARIGVVGAVHLAFGQRRERARALSAGSRGWPTARGVGATVLASAGAFGNEVWMIQGLAANNSTATPSTARATHFVCPLDARFVEFRSGTSLRAEATGKRRQRSSPAGAAHDRHALAIAAAAGAGAAGSRAAKARKTDRGRALQKIAQRRRSGGQIDLPDDIVHALQTARGLGSSMRSKTGRSFRGKSDRSGGVSPRGLCPDHRQHDERETVNIRPRTNRAVAFSSFNCSGAQKPWSNIAW